MSNLFTDALSPLDGGYADKLSAARRIFSEAGLMRERVRVECAWFLALAGGPAANALAKLPIGAREFLVSLTSDPAATNVAAIKEIESRTNHDVKAVEYWLRGELQNRGATPVDLEWMHFGCTSEDINNLAYALMLKSARATLLLPKLGALVDLLDALAARHAAVAMLARTHGQSATPTTVGKEFANVAARLETQRAGIARIAILGKMNGAVGNVNAHVAALPQVDWPAFSATFVESWGLTSNPYTTQIEPHDWIAEYCHAIMRSNTVLLDFARDMWNYISLGYFTQRLEPGEVGSSTMPHKVNPIDFENAEGNLGLASALLRHMSDKLPVSRWQRDLSDSTVLRNLGVALGHTLIAWSALGRGLTKIEADRERMAADLAARWEVLGEAVQTVLRAAGVPGGYERLKEFTRGAGVDAATLAAFIDTLALAPAEKTRLRALKPADYTGLAAQLARRI